MSNRELLLKTIEEMRDEIIEITIGFVKIPNVNPPGENYPKFTNYYSKRAEELGLEATVIEVPQERVEAMGYELPRTNALATLRGMKEQPVLHERPLRRRPSRFLLDTRPFRG